MSRPAAHLESGNRHFELVRRADVPSIGVEYQEYRHQGTGARHIHLAAEDTNNAFMVAFKTIPRDSTGVAHILEHTTLCGSRKFPVRDPFFMMLRRSLNTFMNAFTASDTTAYPFASQNRKDFDNLLEVYLDAVFFPRLDEMDFAQEGHRVEFAVPEDPSSELVYKGVVYNEMKGAMSSPVLQLWQGVQSRLFPTTTFHFNSGGDPRHIPELSYETLKDFHARHYHPSNAVFFTYGDFPVAEHQDKLQRWALREFSAKSLDLAIPDEQRFSAPLTDVIEYASEDSADLESRSHVVMAWLLGPTYRADTVMAARLLETALLGDGASPLRRALETSDLGSSPSEICGLDDSLKEAVFICGLEGARADDADAIEKFILEVLSDVADEGVPDEQLEAALHQMELSQREVGNRLPYGLQLMNRMLTAAIHAGDPLSELDIDPILKRLRDAITDPDYLRSQVRELLLENPHRVRLSMIPDPGLEIRERSEEKRRLADVKAAMSEAARRAVIERALALAARQNEEEDPEVLPRVGVEDVPAELQIPVGSDLSLASMPARWYERATNGLVHQQVIVELPGLDEPELAVLDLLWAFYTELGCGAANYLEMQARQSRTGRFGAASSIRGRVGDVHSVRGFFVLEGHGLVSKIDQIAALTKDLFFQVRFDEHRRLKELVAQDRADAEASITFRGHSLAAMAAARGTGAAAALHHRWDGLGGIERIKKLDERFKEPAQIAAFAERLQSIQEKLLNAPRRLLLVGEAAQQRHIEQAVAAPWRDSVVRATQPRAFQAAAAEERVREAWITSTQVNFCARAYPAIPSEHADAPALSVLGHVLRDGFLHRAIREKGGAYGAGAAYDADSGSFRFYSYRDPRLSETLADFERSLDWLQEGPRERQLEEAILGVIKEIDQPASPAGEAIAAYFGELQGRDAAFRRAYRQRVLEVSLADLRRVATRYLTTARASTAVVTNRENLDQVEALELQSRSI